MEPHLIRNAALRKKMNDGLSLRKTLASRGQVTSNRPLYKNINRNQILPKSVQLKNETIEGITKFQSK